MQKKKKSLTTISGNKITDLLLSPAKHRLDDSAVFQPHKSREDSKINKKIYRRRSGMQKNIKKSVTTISGNKITDLLLYRLSTGWMIVLYFSHTNQGRTKN